MKSLTFHRENALLTDLYELVMLEAYFSGGMEETAVFEFFVRHLPKERNFLMAAGLEQVVTYLMDLRFHEEDLDWLRTSGRFSPSFIESLEDFRFSGDVDAMPEGTVFFADEPILRITAPIREAQFIESRVMNLLHYQTLVASKAARSVIAARGAQLIDFGLRRAHGAEAGLLAARASYIAGFDGTATTLAASLFGVPVFGTMAHSFVQAHKHETEAFSAFARTFPGNATLLIDTYDTEAAAQKIVRLAHRLQDDKGIHIKAVRIDSGNLAEEARRVRQILDDGGPNEIRIFVSGNLDEYALQSLVNDNVPIDGFGVGTHMTTSSDAPFLDCAYKLVEYAGEPTRKRSPAKMTWPGCKQVFRRHDEHGVMCGDMLALQDDVLPGEPLLRPVIRGSMLLESSPPLAEIRAYAQSQVAGLPPALRELKTVPPYMVAVSDTLQELARRVDERRHSLEDVERAHWGR